jgi:DNA-directed RNA polymerase delta subunit
MAKLAFRPQSVTKRLIADLPERSRDVIVSRYGLGAKTKGETLDAIGKRYGITRERVRQIENHGVKMIQDSQALQKETSSFQSLENSLRELGGILPEHMILNEFAKDAETRNHLYFLLVVGRPFISAKESADFKARWFVDQDLAKSVEDALKQVHAKVKPSDVLQEDQLIDHVMTCLTRVNAKYRQKDTVRRWLELSNCLMRNPLGEWGRISAPGIKVKNIRDHAYLALKRHGSPMHFREVAASISKLFGKKAHEATTHNELIKDSRFVLVGRGIYALKEWGYRIGPVVEIIRHILKESKEPLSREEIMKRVGRERYVKPNTIIVNLQNPSFSKTNGKYFLKNA